ncbi:hypothetical protein [uncultured Nostoc sp.]
MSKIDVKEKVAIGRVRRIVGDFGRGSSVESIRGDRSPPRPR